MARIAPVLIFLLVLTTSILPTFTNSMTSTTLTTTGVLETDCEACDNILNAGCIDGACKCKEGFTVYKEMSGFCKAFEVEYNGVCIVKITSKNQCQTPNAKCINGRCVCPGGFFFLNNSTCVKVPAAPPIVRRLIPTEEGFKISLNPPDERDRNGVITNYTIRYAWINNTCWNSDDGVKVEKKIFTNNESDHEVSNLRPYWFYNITVSASTKVGEGPVGWCDGCYFRTKASIPGDIGKIEITTTSSSANLIWETPCETNGIITKYSIFTINKDTKTSWVNDTDGNITQFVVQNLLPYSNYSFRLAANTEKGIGNRSNEIEKRTDIAEPRQPRNPKARNIFSTRIVVTWDTPDLFTGPTRYFCIAVDDKNNSIKLKVSEENGFDARTCTLTGLDEYWTYLITVTASTEVGNTSAKFYVKTAEDIPSAPPYVHRLIPTEEGFKILLNPPDERDRNGVITNYTIRYAWINNTCWDSNDGVKVETKISTNNESDHEVSNLRSYWFYNVTVSASTEVGEGPVGWFDDSYFRTKASIPGGVRKLNIITTSSSASLTWVTPCETNGIITMYSINTTNIDKNTTWANETEGNMTQFVVQNLLPYRNYSFSIAANTEKGVGYYSIREESRTDIAKPHPPRNPKAKNINSTSISITWNPPDLFTGPTRYFVIPIDVKNNNKKLNCCEVTGFEANTCTLTDLDEYWTYSITVTASTDRGNTSSVKFNVSTSEDSLFLLIYPI